MISAAEWSMADTATLLHAGTIALRAVLEQLEQGQYRRFHDLWSGLHGAAQIEARKMGWDGMHDPPGNHWGDTPYNRVLGAVAVPLMVAANVQYFTYFSDVLAHRWDQGRLTDVLRAAIDMADKYAAEAEAAA